MGTQLQPLLTALVAVIAALLSGVVDEWYRRGRPRPSRRQFIVVAPMAVAFLAIGWFSSPHVVESLSSAPPTVRISFPADGDAVGVNGSSNCYDEVKGESTNIPTGGELWLLVVPPAGKDYYVQDGPAVWLGDGRWKARACFGGIGKFDLLVVSVLDEGSRKAFAIHRDLCKELDDLKRSCGPIDSLWDGVTVLDRLSIDSENPGVAKKSSPPTPTGPASKP